MRGRSGPGHPATGPDNAPGWWWRRNRTARPHDRTAPAPRWCAVPLGGHPHGHQRSAPAGRNRSAPSAPRLLPAGRWRQTRSRDAWRPPRMSRTSRRAVRPGQYPGPFGPPWASSVRPLCHPWHVIGRHSATYLNQNFLGKKILPGFPLAKLCRRTQPAPAATKPSKLP